MKNLIRKLTALAIAAVMLSSLAACGNQTAADEPAADNSASTSYTDLSGSDVSGSDVIDPAVDAVAADAVLDEYFTALNNGDAAAMSRLCSAPPILTYLESFGLDEDYLLASYQDFIDSLVEESGGSYAVRYNYIGVDADELELNALSDEIEQLAAGTGRYVKAVRVYEFTMYCHAVTSASDVLDESNLLERSTDTIRLFRYDDQWYVYGE